MTRPYIGVFRKLPLLTEAHKKLRAFVRAPWRDSVGKRPMAIDLESSALRNGIAEDSKP